MTNLSTTAKNILSTLLVGSLFSKEVAAKLEVATTVVTGSLAGLKKNGFVEVLSDNKLQLTAAGKKLVAPVEVVATVMSRKGDKKAAAASIVAAMPGASRKDIMARLMGELHMSATQASTYHYNLAGARGIWK